MHPVKDNELLRDYAESGSEEAFATLVSRHVNMVYSVALRTVGNPDHAQEVAQAVFLVFSRKARSLGPRTVVGGWLFHAARLTASNFVRNEVRRRRREQEVYMQSQNQENDAEDAWAQIAPMLDGAVDSLGARDRNAVVLRFLEGRELAEVGRAIGTSEEAAKKRVHRALEKLRKFFTKRGVVVTGSILASAIAANSASAAPISLSTSITTIGAVKGATLGASALGLAEGTLKIMAWAKLKAVAIGCASVALATSTLVLAVSELQNPHDPRDNGKGLTINSPFVLHLANPPWIKNIRYVESMRFEFLTPPGGSNIPGLWLNQTNEGALQPGGYYHETLTFLSNSPAARRGGRRVSGVDDSNFWSANTSSKELDTSPVRPEVGGSPADNEQKYLRLLRNRLEQLRNYGLPALSPGSFSLVDSNHFTAITGDGKPLKGRILGTTADRPLSLSYRLGTNEVFIKYQYASKAEALPLYFEYLDPSLTPHATRTNWILSLEYGLDSSASNGYPITRFFPDLGQFVNQVKFSNEVGYLWGFGSNEWRRPPVLSEENQKRLLQGEPLVGRGKN